MKKIEETDVDGGDSVVKSEAKNVMMATARKGGVHIARWLLSTVAIVMLSAGGGYWFKSRAVSDKLVNDFATCKASKDSIISYLGETGSIYCSLPGSDKGFVQNPKSITEVNLPTTQPTTVLSPSPIVQISTPSPAVIVDISTLMPDVACRTHYLAKDEDISTDQATVLYMDYNGDKVKEAVVGLKLNGTGKYGLVCAYSIANGQLKLDWTNPKTDVQAFGRITTGASEDTFVYSYSVSGSALDSTPAAYIYKWNGTGFLK
jgi:hypothetical protein